MNGLEPKMAAFVREYVVDFNGTQAAIRAGYSRRSARVSASRMLAKANVQTALKLELERVRSQVNPDKQEHFPDTAPEYKPAVTAERVLAEEMCISYLDLRQIWKQYEMVPPDKLPEAVARAVASFEVDEIASPGGLFIRKYHYRFHDKGRSLERLGRHLGMYTDKVEQVNREPIKIIFNRAAPVAATTSKESAGHAA